MTHEEFYQYSTIGALIAGVDDGDLTVGELLRHGDLGVGTFNRLDGELVVVDGVGYRVRADGTATVARHSDRTPFAAVCRFRPSLEFGVQLTSLAEITARIDEVVGSANIPLALRIDGRFSQVSTRTVRAQSRPYPSLVEATADQQEASLVDTQGVLVGFRTPRFGETVSVGGYHLHYVDDARERGGHVRDIRALAARVVIDTLKDIHLELPDRREFRDAVLDPESLPAQVARAEN